MLIHESGIIVESIPIVYANYRDANNKNINIISKTAFMTSLLNFAETFLEPVEYFEGSKYNIVFKHDKIENNKKNLTNVYVYVIFDKESEFNKHLKKKIMPLLTKILKQFKQKYHGMEFADVSKFSEFKDNIDKILAESSKTLDDKVSSLFS